MPKDFLIKLEENQLLLLYISRMLNPNQERITTNIIPRSNRLALSIDNNICIISLVTSDVLVTIPLHLSRSDEYNSLNCLAWSNNGKLLAYAHWSGIVCVYSSNDGQLLHELSTKSVLFRS
jgi:WD40 repeat protein